MNCKDINSLDMIEVLKDLGYRHVTKREDEYMFIAKYRNDSNASLCINPIKRCWYDFGIGVGGKLVDLLMLILPATKVSDVINYCDNKYKYLFSFSKQSNGSQKEKNKSYAIQNIKQPIIDSRLISYLSERGISKDSWLDFILEIHYENQYGNFTAIAFKNDQGGYEIRNKLMKSPVCLGPKDITTITGSKTEVVVFEGFFDFLSYVELGLFKEQTVIVLNTTSKTAAGLKAITEGYKEATVDTYFDNDDAGLIATRAFREVLPESKSNSVLFSGFNDLNDYLKSRKKPRQIGRFGGDNSQSFSI